MFVLTGLDLGPSRLEVARSFPLQRELAGTSIRVTVGGASVDALMVYTSLGQVAAVLPSTTPVGDGTLVLTHQGRTSRPKRIQVVRNRFGIFTRNQAGTGPGIIQNVNSQADRPINSLVDVARPNQTVILWGTGLGAANGDEAAGPVPGDMDVRTDVLVGGKLARVVYRGRSGCCAGVDQIVFEVPPGTEGCYVPVAVRAGDRLSNFVTMSIGSQGKTCPDLAGFSEGEREKLQRGEPLRLGEVLLGRLVLRISASGIAIEVTADLGLASFASYGASNLLASLNAGSFLHAGAAVPGSCVVIQQTSFDSLFPVYLSPERPQYLQAGSALEVTGPRGAKRLSRSGDRYFGVLGDSEGEFGPLYLEPGTYTVENGLGGEDVGSFRASLTVPGPLNWTNRYSIREVSRTQDLTLTWSSSDSDQQVVTIFGVSLPSAEEESGAVLLCTERASAGRFTVPSWVLSALPESATYEGIPVGFLGLMNSTPASESVMRAPGIDVGRIQCAILQMNNVGFR